MDDDPYAFCYQIEKDASEAFNKAGLPSRSRVERVLKLSPESPPGIPIGIGAGARSCARSTTHSET
jgi:hypothetical protein